MFRRAGRLHISPMCLCMSKAIIASRAKERQNRVKNKHMMSVSPWNDRFEMAKYLCWTQLHRSTAGTPGLRALLIIPFKWNVNPRFPQFLPCQYLFDSRSAPVYPGALLPPRLVLFLLMLCLSLNLPFLPSALALSSYLPLFFPFLPISGWPEGAADGYRLQPTKAGEFLSHWAQPINPVS